MYLNYLKNINIFSIILSFLPLFFIAGVALNNIYSVLMSFYGIYLFFFIKKYNYKKNLYLNLFLVFTILLIFSSLISDFKLESSKTSFPYLLYYFYFIASIHILNEWKEINFKYFVISIYISVIILFFFSIIQYFTLVRHDQGDLIYYYRYTGIKSLFENKILGIYLVKFFPLFIGLKIYLREKLRFYDYIIIFMIFLMMLFSYHRTSILIFLLFIFLTFILIKEFRNYFMSISILSILTFLVSIFLFPDLSKSIISKTKNQILTEKSINLYPEHYLGHYKTSIKMIKKNLISGTGPNTFKQLCSHKEYEIFYDEIINHNGETLKLNSCTTHTHNFYLQIFSESGVFTFLLLSFFYIFIFKELVLCLIGKNSIQDNQFYKICLICTLCNFFPFAPSVDFFNTYLNSILYMPCIFILYFKLKSKNFFVSY